MSKRVDEREQTLVCFDVYQKLLNLSDFTFSVCKPKEKNVNNKHIPKRLISVGNMAIETVTEIGALILEANDKYVGKNIDIETRIVRYQRRIETEELTKSLTYRLEHIIRTLHKQCEFADSTITYWIGLLVDTRRLIVAWRDSDMAELNALLK